MKRMMSLRAWSSLEASLTVASGGDFHVKAVKRGNGIQGYSSRIQNDSVFPSSIQSIIRQSIGNTVLFSTHINKCTVLKRAGGVSDECMELFQAMISDGVFASHVANHELTVGEDDDTRDA